MKRALILAAVALSAAACTATLPATPSTPAPPVTGRPSAAQTASSAPASPSCDAALWVHVYHPDRLKVIEQCRTVTGVIRAIRFEPDGDTHADLEVQDPSLVNAKNVQYQHGDLVLEEICQGPVTQADAIAACQGVPRDLTIPKVGDQVTVTGSYVLDQAHGWMEIHPVTSLDITSGG